MLILCAVMRKKNMRTARNIFIFNLAFSDMILGASVPFTIMVKLSRQFPFQPFDISCRYTKIFFRACIIKQIQDIKSLTLSWQGYKNDDFGRGGGHSMAPPKITLNEATEACEGSK